MEKVNIYYMSDLHLEMRNRNWVKKILCSKIKISNKLPGTYYILVLAGDIGNPYMDSWKELIKHCHVVFDVVLYVSGNHEYYHRRAERSMGEVDEYILNSFKVYGNVYYLNNQYMDVNLESPKRTVRFIGTTLWTRISDTQKDAVMNTLNDFRNIYSESGKLWSIDSLNAMCSRNCSYLSENTLNMYDTVVISHHVPSPSLIPERYACYGSISNAYSVEMKELYQKDNVKYWIFGHSHGNTFKLMDGCLFVSNCMGYTHETDIYANFDASRSILL